MNSSNHLGLHPSFAERVKDCAMPRSRPTSSGSNSGMTRKHRAAGVNLRAGVGTGPQLNLVANSRLVRGRCSFNSPVSTRRKTAKALIAIWNYEAVSLFHDSRGWATGNLNVDFGGFWPNSNYGAYTAKWRNGGRFQA